MLILIDGHTQVNHSSAGLHSAKLGGNNDAGEPGLGRGPSGLTDFSTHLAPINAKLPDNCPGTYEMDI